MHEIQGPPPAGEISIKITQVANGWIVQMPVLYENQDLASIAQRMMEGIQGTLNGGETQDEVLRKIMEENKIVPEAPKYKELKDKSTHIFTHFHEVLEFLEKAMEIPKPQA